METHTRTSFYDPKATKQTVRAEVRHDIEALDSYESVHGSFPEMVREYYRGSNNDENNS